MTQNRNLSILAEGVNSSGVLQPSNGGTGQTSLTLSNATYTASLTGAVSRATNAKLGDIASVKDFGAAGDGVTDDTAALALAQAWYARATAPILYFPEGVYVYSVSPQLGASRRERAHVW